MISLKIALAEAFLSHNRDNGGFNYKYWSSVVKTIIHCAFYDFNITFVGIPKYDAHKRHHMLKTGEVDVYLPGSVLTHLSADIRTTPPYAYTFHHILSTIEVNKQVPQEFFIASLSLQVWLCVITSILILSVVMSVQKTFQSSFPFRFLNNLLFITSMFIQKSCTPMPFGYVQRLTTGTWLLAVTIITSFYYGSLTTTSTMVRADTIDTMEDVARHPQGRVVFPKYISMNADNMTEVDLTFNSFIRQSDEKRTRNFYETHPRKTVKQVYQRKVFYFTTYRNLLNYLTSAVDERKELNKQKLFYIGKGEYFFSSVVVLTNPKLLKHVKSAIDRRMRRAFETAQFRPQENLVAHFLHGYIWEGKISKFEYTAVQAKTLNVVFSIWVAGMLVSLLSLVVEWNWHATKLRDHHNECKTSRQKFAYS